MPAFRGRPPAEGPSRAGQTPPRLALVVQNLSAATDLPHRSTLRRWIRVALSRDAQVTLRFVGTREGRMLNARFRARDYATNVLTFVYDDVVPLQGDLVLCVPVLRREALALHIPFRAHCAHLVIHGMLHLQGYDHERTAEARRMEALESRLLARLRYPDPYRFADALD